MPDCAKSTASPLRNRENRGFMLCVADMFGFLKCGDESVAAYSAYLAQLLDLTIISIVIISSVMDENLAMTLSDVARHMRRAFDARAREIGVTRPQWQVLAVLRRNEGINQGGLAELLEVEPITVCRMVDRLQEAGLVERRPDPADRRSWRLHLTERASGLLGKLKPLADDMLEQALSGVSDEQRDALSTILQQIRSNLLKRTNSIMVSNG
jgi:DNA-binding MarR family transcriptional regulator